jgi:hypothetical protein
MTKLHKSLVGLAATLLVGIGVAVAQIMPGLFVTNLTGSEQVNIVNAGPQIATVLTSTLRNTTGYLISTQTTGTITTLASTNNLILTGAATTLTVNPPASPPDGQLFAINNGTGSNFSGTITLTTTDGSTITNGSTAVNLSSAASEEWQYTAASKIWYRLR